MAAPSKFPPRVLGRSGLMVGALGQSSSYGAPTKSVEECFEQGMNYLYYGSLRRAAFAQAVRNLSPQRDRMVLVVQSYTRFPLLMRGSVKRALRQLGTSHADVLLLGWWDQRPWEGILETAMRLREEGLVRFIGISSHNRPLLAKMTEALDVFHVRYNAVHRGAEEDVFPHLTAGGPGVVAYTATSWKQLLGDKRIPAAERTPTAADCYRFVLSNPSVDVSMTGAANADQARQSLEALRQGPMDPDELAWMRRVGDAIYGKT